MHTKRESIFIMRILVLSNFYPPHSLGGYEVGCQQVIQQLKQRGHEINILTSCYNSDSSLLAEDGVHRLLELDSPYFDENKTVRVKGRQSIHLVKRAYRQLKQRAILRNIIAEFRPDTVNVWNLGGLCSNILLEELHRQHIPMVICAADYWLEDLLKGNYNNEYWLQVWQKSTSNPIKRLMKSLLHRPTNCLLPTELAPINWPSVCFISQALKNHYINSGLPADMSPVVHWGVTSARFQPRERDKDEDSSLRLLFAGRLVPEKGTHTILEALELMMGQLTQTVSLSIVGKQSSDYEDALRSHAAMLSGSYIIKFLGAVPHDQMPEIYQQHDVFVFPSTWEEPFGLVLLEAMASGLTVISTAVGGAGEIVKDELNSLIFKAGSADDLSRQLRRLIEEPLLRERISTLGQKIVRDNFDITATVDGIESLLHQAKVITYPSIGD